MNKIKDKKKRGRPRQGVFDNNQITKAIFMIAIGLNAKTEIIKEVKEPNWSSRLSKKLLKHGLISKVEGTFETNKKYYCLNWDNLIERIFDIMEERIILNSKEIDNSFERLSELNYPTQEEREHLEKKIKDKKRKPLIRFTEREKVFKDLIKISNLIKENKVPIRKKKWFFNLKIRHWHRNILKREFLVYQEQISNFLKEIHKARDSFNEECKRWIISELTEYFEELYYSKPLLDTLDEEFKRFLIIMSFKYKSIETPINLKSHLINLINRYNKYSILKLEWLVITKPQYNREVIKLEEEYEKHLEKEAIKREEQRQEEFEEKLSKAKDIHEKYNIVYEYKGELAAEKYLDQELSIYKNNFVQKRKIFK